MKKNKKFLFFLVGFSFLWNFALYESTGSESSDLWKTKEGTVLIYDVWYKNSNASTKIDEMAQEYHFNSLVENFYGNSEIQINLTGIDTSIPINDLVADFMNFTAPFICNQIINNTEIAQKSVILPLCVPVENWAEIESEFERYAEVSVTNTLTFEYSYELEWVDHDQEIAVNLVWDERTGNLEVANYNITYQGMTDEISFIMSEFKGPNYSNNLKLALFLIGGFGVLIFIGLGIGFHLISKKSQIENRPFLQKSHNRETQNREKIPNREESRRIIELNSSAYQYSSNFSRFKRQYLKQWGLFNSLSILTFVVGVILLIPLSNDGSHRTLFWMVFFISFMFPVLFIILLNRPLRKLRKIHEPAKIDLDPRLISKSKIFQYSFSQWQFMDESPFITFIGCFIVGFAFLILTNLTSNLQTNLLLVFMALSLLGLLGLLCYRKYPFKMLRDLKIQAEKDNYDFAPFLN